MAVAAMPAENEPTHDRYIVVEGDWPMAIGAGGSRRDYRQAPRKPVDTHIQKAAKCQPEEKNRCCDHRIHVDLGTTQRCVPEPDLSFPERADCAFLDLSIVMFRSKWIISLRLGQD